MRLSFQNRRPFSVDKRAARPGCNPQTGETIKIAASKVAKFSAAKALKENLNGAKGTKAVAKKSKQAAA